MSNLNIQKYYAIPELDYNKNVRYTLLCHRLN